MTALVNNPIVLPEVRTPSEEDNYVAVTEATLSGANYEELPKLEYEIALDRLYRRTTPSTTSNASALLKEAFDASTEDEIWDLAEIVTEIKDEPILDRALLLKSYNPAIPLAQTMKAQNKALRVLEMARELNTDKWYEDVLDLPDIIAEGITDAYYTIAPWADGIDEQTRDVVAKWTAEGVADPSEWTDEQRVEFQEDLEDLVFLTNPDADIRRLERIITMSPLDASSDKVLRVGFGLFDAASLGASSTIRNSLTSTSRSLANRLRPNDVVDTVTANVTNADVLAQTIIKTQKERNQVLAGQASEGLSRANTFNIGATPEELAQVAPRLHQAIESSISKAREVMRIVEERGLVGETLEESAERVNQIAEVVGRTSHGATGYVSSRVEMGIGARNGEGGSLVINDVTGAAFGTREAAKNAADEITELYGMKTTVEGSGTEFSVRLSLSTETSTLEGLTMDAIEGYMANVRRGLLEQPSAYLDKTFNNLLRGVSSSEAYLTRRISEIYDDVRKAAQKSGASEDDLAATLDALANKWNIETFVEPDEYAQFFHATVGRVPTQADLALYQGFKAIQDTTYAIKNRLSYANKVARGAVRLELPSGVKVLGREGFDVERVATLPTRDEDAITVVLDSGKAFTAKMSDEGIANSGDLYRILDPIDGNYRYIINRNMDVKQGEISAIRNSGYIGGGRFTPDYDFYLKALTPSGERTLFGSISRRLTNELAGNTAFWRYIASKNGSKYHGGALTSVNRKIASFGVKGVRTMDDAEKLLRESGLTPDDIMKMAEGKLELKTFAANQRWNPVARQMEEVDDPIELERIRRDFSRSNRRVSSIDSGTPKYLSPLDAMSRDVSVASRLGMDGLARQKAINSFVKNYGELMSGGARGRDPLAVLRSEIDPKAVDNLSIHTGRSSADIKSEIELVRGQLQHHLRHANPIDIKFQAATREIADMFYGKKFFGDFFGHNLNKVARFRPVDEIKAVMFDTALGLLAPTTFIQQMLWTSNIMIARGGQMNWRYVQTLPAAFQALRMTDEALAEFAKMSRKIPDFLEPDEFIEVVKTFREGGFGTYTRSMINMDVAKGYDAARPSRGLGAIETARDWGRVTFKAGDIIPRMVAHLDGYGEAAARGIQKGTKEHREFMADWVNKWTLGVTGEDIPLFMKRGLGGFAQLPTQFMSYPVKMITSLWNKNFTAKERWMLATSYAATAGTLAVPMSEATVGGILEVMGFEGDTKYEKIVDMMGEDGIMATAMHSGVWDAMIYAATDGELRTELGARLSPDFMTYVVDRFENGTPELFLFGASASLGDSWKKDMNELAYMYSAAGDPDAIDFTLAGFHSLARRVKSFNVVERMWMIEKFGEMRDRRGNPVISDAGVLEQFALFAGLNLRDYNEYYREGGSLRDQSESQDRMIRRLAELHRELFNETDEQTRAELSQAANSLAVLLLKDGVTPDRIRSGLRRNHAPHITSLIENRQRQQEIRDQLIANMRGDE